MDVKFKISDSTNDDIISFTQKEERDYYCKRIRDCIGDTKLDSKIIDRLAELCEKIYFEGMDDGNYK